MKKVSNNDATSKMSTDSASSEQLQDLLNQQLKVGVLLNQFLLKNKGDEALQGLVQCYVFDLIDWLRFNVKDDAAAFNDPIALLQVNVLADLERAVEAGDNSFTVDERSSVSES